MPRNLSIRRLLPLSGATAVMTLAVVAGWLSSPLGHSQQPVASTPNVALNAMLSKLKTQQDQMAANQTKIEAQTAQLQESLRQAKIYSARSGAGHR